MLHFLYRMQRCLLRFRIVNLLQADDQNSGRILLLLLHLFRFLYPHLKVQDHYRGQF